MITLADLRLTLQHAQQRTESLKQEIAMHPERLDEVRKLIRESFAGKADALLEPVLSTLSYYEEVSGVTDSRKNMMKYHGWRFGLGGAALHTVTTGSNWCSYFYDLGTTELESEQGKLMDLCGEEENMQAVAEYIMTKDAPTAFALMMMVTEGW